MLKNFKLFVEKNIFTEDELWFVDMLLENKLVFTTRFEDILKKIDDPISEYILGLEGEDNKNMNINYIDASDKEGLVSFIPDTKYNELDDDVNIKYKKDIKIGKIVQKLTQLKEIKYKETDLENFVSKFKSEQKDSDVFKFQLIKGSAIYKYYQTEFYEGQGGEYMELSVTKNELWNSCMNNKPLSYFDLYTKNEDQASLLILKGNGEKIYGRCLIWTTTLGKRVMDRIYFIKPYMQYLFEKYAKENDIMVKGYNKSEVDNENKFKMNGDVVELNMEVKLDLWNFKFYPFCDTFRYLDFKTGILSNNPDLYYKYIEDDECGVLMSNTGAADNR